MEVHFKATSPVILTKSEDPDTNVLITAAFMVIRSTFLVDERPQRNKVK